MHVMWHSPMIKLHLMMPLIDELIRMWVWRWSSWVNGVDITILCGLMGLCHWGTYLDFLWTTQTAILTKIMMNQEYDEYDDGHCNSHFYDTFLMMPRKVFIRGPRYLNCDWSQRFKRRVPVTRESDMISIPPAVFGSLWLWHSQFATVMKRWP